MLTVTKMQTKKVQPIKTSVTLLDGVTAKLEGSDIIMKGKKGEVKRSFESAQVKITVDDGKINLSAPRDNRNFRAMVNTFVAHLGNMQKGAMEGHVYVLRICSGHFPMNVAVSKDELIIKNYVGERVARTMKIPQGIKVTIAGRDITLESTSKELAGKVASDIEQLTRRSNFDRRVFQDGIFIVSKDGESVR